MTTIPDSIEELENYLKPHFATQEALNNANEKDVYEKFDNFNRVLQELLTLPPFYDLPELKPMYYIHGSLDNYIVYDSDNNKVFESPVLHQAYNHARKLGDFRFTGDYTHVDKNWTPEKNDIFVDVKDDKAQLRGTELFLSFTSQDEIYLEYSNYFSYLKDSLNYLKNPKDFMNAWHFLDNHPFAWMRKIHNNKTYWVKDQNISKMWLQPSFDNNKITFMMEAGAAIEPNRSSTYHDLRLDVYASSYNNAIIEMAALVHKFFHLDGTERENVDY